MSPVFHHRKGLPLHPGHRALLFQFIYIHFNFNSTKCSVQLLWARHPEAAFAFTR